MTNRKTAHALSAPQRIRLERLAVKIRRDVLRATTAAGSGHPTSSLSSADLLTVLFFGGFFRARLDEPSYPNNDRLIFSKGHAAPLLYALYAAAGKISDRSLMSLRKFSSALEGHPSMRFPYTESPTGSLGQGLSIGVGFALNAKYLDMLDYRTYVLIGDSEMAEGSVWEAIQIASHYRLNNLVGILDLNRLGQTGPTMCEHNADMYRKRVASFGWDTIVINGHSLDAIHRALCKSQKSTRPCMIIAKTLKGAGVSFLKNKNGWHGKALNQQELSRALQELGGPSAHTGTVALPHAQKKQTTRKAGRPHAMRAYTRNEQVATRKAYGNALARLGKSNSKIIVLDAEVGNSTYADIFKKAFPRRFFEMYIAEQNMVGTALGLACRGNIPCVSTFAAFLTRAFDQIRMSQYAHAHILFAGSHAGVSIGQDGPSQMGLEDVAMFRTLQHSTVLYPADTVSCERLVENAIKGKGILYIRTTRAKTPVLYRRAERFPLGGSKTLKASQKDAVTLIGAGITLHECLGAHELLKQHGIRARVIDLYSVKPLDGKTLRKAARETRALFVVEDHVAEGGIADAVRSALDSSPVPVHSLAVKKIPRSGTPDELLSWEQIDRASIERAVVSFLNT